MPHCRHFTIIAAFFLLLFIGLSLIAIIDSFHYFHFDDFRH